MNEVRDFTLQDPVALLQALIRFDTTNPPGIEAPCIGFIADRLEAMGASTTRLESAEGRPNLLTRLDGRGDAPPLLFYGHVDVVTTRNQLWSVPPFEGRIQDGWVWGRGALDMKSAVAMMTAAFTRAHHKQVRPAGDIILALLADEEAGGRHGAQFLVQQHPELFKDVRFAVGEFGGIPFHLDGKRFYLIQIAEKQPCWLEASIQGQAGHGARPARGGAMAKLADILARIDRWRSPIHITDASRQMIETLAAYLSPVKRVIIRRLLNPRWTDRVLSLLGETGRAFEPLFRHTVNATVVHGGEKANVIPSEITLGLDARILPGYSLDEFLTELRPILGADVDVRVLLHDPSTSDPDYGLFDQLGRILAELDPEAIPVPFLLPGSTDARFFDRLGIQTYGFTPMNLPAGFDFFSTIHAADERVPVSCLEFGTKAYERLMATWRG